MYGESGAFSSDERSCWAIWPLQFAYKAHRGVEDACLTLFDLVSHLEDSESYIRILFIDFSSAFNTVELLVLLKRVVAFNVNSNIVLWVRGFWKDRPQRVSVNGVLSDELVLNSGCPQGCCLSPTVFSIYTDHMRANTAVTYLLKFADDMALVGMLKDEDSFASCFSLIDMVAS